MKQTMWHAPTVRVGVPYGKPGDFLYHYTSLATAVEHIIPSQTLLLNPFRRLNDPREASGCTCSRRRSGLYR